MAIRKKRASKNPQRGGVKDAVALLKQDHAEVKKLLSQLEATSLKSASKRQSLLGKIALEVRIHARIEEEIFYPAFRGAGRKGEDQKTFFEAREEHGLVDHVLPQLEGTDPQTELFSARAKVLKDLIEHHAEEEENEMLPRARELMSREELETLGTKLQQRKQELMGQGMNGRRPRARRPSSFVSSSGQRRTSSSTR